MNGAGSVVGRVVAVAVALLLGMSGLAAQAQAAKKAPKVNASPDYVTRSSVGEIYIKDADAGQELMLVNSLGQIKREGKADSFGSKIFYFLKEGAKFRVLSKKDGKVMGSPVITVRKRANRPKQSFYANQELRPGLNYVKMRDGVELAVTVRLPKDGLRTRELSEGPFPTFIEYSGYQVAAPKDFVNAILPGGNPNDPLLPASSTAVGSAIGPLLDFATVSVQMRGSGCSGGAFDLFGLPTVYDGYDIVETVAAQDWVKGGKVGMGGISFSGITQLLVGGTQPPSLAGITPLSVTDDIYTATGYPGGIFNNGFAYSWIRDRARDALPAPEGGQAYARILSDPEEEAFDPKCAANQDMRLQTQDYEAMIERNPFRTPELFKERAPGYWVDKIKAPVYLAGAFQDEQTGGHFVNSLSRLADNKNVWLNLMNGVHSDPLGPSTIGRMVEFLNLFVADRIPRVPDLILSLSGSLYDELTGAPSIPVNQSQFADYTSLAKAKADFRKFPRVRLFMDNGNGLEGEPGAIGHRWELNYSSWPIKQVKPTSWYLGEGGSLQRSKPGSLKTTSYTGDAEARPAQTISRGDEWAAQPEYDWAPVADGKGLGFTSPALTADTVLGGNISLDLWLKSSALDTDLQATLSEVRPDGKETLVQSGWLRASHRKLAKGSTALYPIPTHLEKDAQPLRSGAWNYVRVPVFPVAHAFRAGSKVRLTIQAPGGDRQIWRFDTLEDGSITNTIGLGGKFPSKLVLPVLSGATAKGTPLPSATALRGQPSRDYETASNGG